MDDDKLSAYQTLHTVLKEISILAAPIAPFYMDRLYRDIIGSESSVHFVLMPECDDKLVDKDLEERMELAQKASSMILALRRKVNIKVRQPLSKIMVPIISDKIRRQFEMVKSLILGEVNVKDVEFIDDTAGVITKKIKPNFKSLGKLYGKQMKEIATAFGKLSQKDIAEIQSAENSGNPYTLHLISGDVILRAGDYEISSEDMPGWLVASEGSLTIALDIDITPELLKEGTARELINRIQNLRKDSGFEVTDKINIIIYASDKAYTEVEDSLKEYSKYIESQTLALSIQLSDSLSCPDKAVEVEWDGGMVKILVEREQ